MSEVTSVTPSKPASQSWTLIFNGATFLAVGGFIVWGLTDPNILAIIPASAYPYILAVVAAVNYWLRYYRTSTAIAK